MRSKLLLFAALFVLVSPSFAEPDATEKLLDLGELQMRNRDYKAALTYFERAIAGNPANVHAHIGRQEARIRDGQEEGLQAEYENRYLKNLGDPAWTFLYARLLKPEECLKTLKKSNEETFFVLLAAARAESALGEVKEADLIRLESKCPRLPRELGLLAGLFEDLGQYRKAIDNFEAARKIAPGRIDAIVGSANCNRLAENYDKALEAITEAVKLAQDDPEVLYRKGLIHYDRDEADLAIKSFEASLGVLRDDVDVILAWGDAYLLKEAPKDAEAKYRLAVKLDSRRIDAQRRLAYTLEILDRNDEALAAYETVARLDPLDAPCHTAMGWILTKKGKFENAIREFRQASDLDRDDIAPLFFIGYAYDLMGRWGEAIDAYEKVVKKFGEFAPAWNNLGLDQDLLGKGSKAIRALKKAVALDAENIDYLLNLANAYYNDGKYKDAIEEFAKVTKIDPKIIEAWTGLARSHNRLRRYKDAAEAYEKALELDPEDADLHLMAGILYDENLKEYDKAVAHYEKYQELGGSDPNVQFWLEEAQKKAK